MQAATALTGLPKLQAPRGSHAMPRARTAVRTVCASQLQGKVAIVTGGASGKSGRQGSERQGPPRGPLARCF